MIRHPWSAFSWSRRAMRAGAARGEKKCGHLLNHARRRQHRRRHADVDGRTLAATATEEGGTCDHSICCAGGVSCERLAIKVAGGGTTFATRSPRCARVAGGFGVHFDRGGARAAISIRRRGAAAGSARHPTGRNFRLRRLRAPAHCRLTKTLRALRCPPPVRPARSFPSSSREPRRRVGSLNQTDE